MKRIIRTIGTKCINLNSFHSAEQLQFAWICAAPTDSACRVADLREQQNDHRSTSGCKPFHVNTSSWGLHKYRIRQSVIFSFHILFPPSFCNIPRLGWLRADAGSHFKKLQLPYDSSAKRFSFNLNQQMWGAQTWRRVFSLRNNSSPGSIWNLNCGETVFVINNQIFEPVKYLCPISASTLLSARTCLTGFCFHDYEGRKELLPNIK